MLNAVLAEMDTLAAAFFPNVTKDGDNKYRGSVIDLQALRAHFVAHSVIEFDYDTELDYPPEGDDHAKQQSRLDVIEDVSGIIELVIRVDYLNTYFLADKSVKNYSLLSSTIRTLVANWPMHLPCEGNADNGSPNMILYGRTEDVYGFFTILTALLRRAFYFAPKFEESETPLKSDSEIFIQLIFDDEQPLNVNITDVLSQKPYLTGDFIEKDIPWCNHKLIRHVTKLVSKQMSFKDAMSVVVPLAPLAPVATEVDDYKTMHARYLAWVYKVLLYAFQFQIGTHEKYNLINYNRIPIDLSVYENNIGGFVATFVIDGNQYKVQSKFKNLAKIDWYCDSQLLYVRDL